MEQPAQIFPCKRHRLPGTVWGLQSTVPRLNGRPRAHAPATCCRQKSFCLQFAGSTASGADKPNSLTPGAMELDSRERGRGKAPEGRKQPGKTSERSGNSEPVLGHPRHTFHRNTVQQCLQTTSQTRKCVLARILVQNPHTKICKLSLKVLKKPEAPIKRHVLISPSSPLETNEPEV